MLGVQEFQRNKQTILVSAVSQTNHDSARRNSVPDVVSMLQQENEPCCETFFVHFRGSTKNISNKGASQRRGRAKTPWCFFLPVHKISTDDIMDVIHNTEPRNFGKFPLFQILRKRTKLLVAFHSNLTCAKNLHSARKVRCHTFCRISLYLHFLIMVSIAFRPRMKLFM